MITHVVKPIIKKVVHVFKDEESVVTIREIIMADYKNEYIKRYPDGFIYKGKVIKKIN